MGWHPFAVCKQCHRPSLIPETFVRTEPNLASTRLPKKAGVQLPVRRQTSAAAVNRFFQDHRLFLAPAAEEAGLVWKQEEWQQFDPAERAILQGMPPALIEAVALQFEQESDSNQEHGGGFGISCPVSHARTSHALPVAAYKSFPDATTRDGSPGTELEATRCGNSV